MKILIVGASGTIGKSVYQNLKQKHELITASRNSGTYQVDITSVASIKNLFEATGKLDAIVNCAGAVKWNDLSQMTEDDFYVGIKSKMMGQVNLVQIGKEYLNPEGSITLTTGILADDPVRHTAGAALVNGAINSFVIAAARELKNGIRINVVAPGVVEDASDKTKSLFPGQEPVSMKKVVNAYIRSIEGNVSGEIIKIYQ